MSLDSEQNADKEHQNTEKLKENHPNPVGVLFRTKPACEQSVHTTGPGAHNLLYEIGLGGCIAAMAQAHDGIRA